MPRVPTYEPGQIGPVRTTGERFQVPQMGQNPWAAAAEGIAGLAAAQDKVEIENDQTQARLALAGARGRYAGALDQFKALKMGAARAGQVGFEAGLDAIRKDVLGTATTPRMRQFIEEGLIDLDGSTRAMGASHAFEQSREETGASFRVEQDALVDAAVGSDDPAFRDRSGLLLRDSVKRQLQFDGLDEKVMPDAYAIAEKAAMSKLHAGVLDRMFAMPDPDLDQVGQYLTAYRDEMTSDLYTKTLERMQGPLQERIDDHSADLIDVAPVQGQRPAAGTVGAWQSVAVSVAQRFGLDPSDVAAVMSYETGGTFSPTKMGGKGGNYMGLIQFGPEERKKYGITKSSSPEQWTTAVGDYLQDRGFRRGMGMLDLYSTINAGRPGRYEASDGNGTVRSHVAEILGAHKEKARGWLGGGGIYDNAPRQWDKAAVFDSIEKKGAELGWTPERVKRVKDVWAKRMSSDEGLLSDQRRAADEAATTLLAKAGDQFRTSMIPRETWNVLGPDQQIQFGNIEKELTKAKAPAPNSETVVALHRMAITNPAGFAQYDLRKAQPYMTAGEFDELGKAQAQAAKDLSNPKAMDVRGKIDAAIRRAKTWEGLDLDASSSEGFRTRRYMELRAQEMTAAGKQPTDDDFSRFARDASKMVKGGDWLGIGSARANAFLSGNMRAAIVRSLQRNGVEPTEDAIQKYWERMGEATK